MSLGSIVVRLSLATADFETDSARAAKVAEKRSKEIEASFRKAGVAIGVFLAGAAVAIGSALKKTLEEADELSKMASKIGISTEALSQLDYAAKLSDVSLDSLGNAVKRLGQFQVEALQGSKEQVAILKSLGIEAEDASTGGLRSAQAMLGDLADLFASMPDGADKTAIAVKLLGKSGADLIPLLNGGSKSLREFAQESDRVGYTLKGKTGKDVEAFNDTLTTVGLSIDGLWRESLPALLDPLQDFADILNSDDFREGFKTLISGAVTAISALAKLGTTFANVSHYLGEELAARVGGPAGDDIVRIEQAIARKKQEIAMLAPREGTGGRFDSTVQIKALRAELAKLQAQERAYQANFGSLARKPPALDTGLPAIEIPKIDWGGGGNAGKSPRAKAAEDEAAALRKLMDADEALYQQMLGNVDIGTDLLNQQTEARQQRESITAQLDGPLAEAELDHIRRMQEIAQVGAVAKKSAEEIAAAQDKETAAYLKSAAAIADYQKMLDNPEAARLLDGFRSETAQTLSDLARDFGNAKEIIGNFFDSIADMIADAIAQHWIDQLFGKPGTTGQGSAAGGGLFDILASIFSFGGGKASGGWTSPNTLYEVNERGFEMATVGNKDYMLTGPNPVQITPNHALRSGVAQTNNFYLAAPTDPRTQHQIAARTAFEITRAQRRDR